MSPIPKSKSPHCGLMSSFVQNWHICNYSQSSQGKPIKKRHQYLDKFHMVIVFGEFMELGGNRYALRLGDVATIYCLVYGMSSLSYTSITSSLENFKSEAGKLPKQFHSNFNRNMIFGNSLL